MFWDIVSQEEVLKEGMPNVGFEVFTPKGEGLNFFLAVGLHVSWTLLPASVLFFSCFSQCVVVTQAVP